MQSALATYQDHVKIPEQAADESHLVRMWLFGKATRTVKEYTSDLTAFRSFTGGVPLHAVTVSHLQEYVTDMQRRGLAVRTINRRLACIKSLCSFALRLGYLRFSPAAPVRGLKIPCNLGELIVSEGDVLKMLALSEGHQRNHAILLLFYAGGLRASELCGLSWRDFREVEDGEAVLHILGKGSKSRHVTLTASVWATVKALKHDDDGLDDAVFKSRKGGRHLSCGQIWRIVKNAGLKAGLDRKMRPHILRHCNASHSLSRGCPLAVIQATLGHASLGTTSIYVHVARGESSGRYLAVWPVLKKIRRSRRFGHRGGGRCPYGHVDKFR